MSIATSETICCQMPAEQYHADKTAWSKSMLMDFRERRSTCHVRHILGTAPEEKSSRAMDLGDLAHAALLEPHRLETDYVAIPRNLLAKNGALSTTVAKDFVAEQEAAGRVVLKQNDFEAVAHMVQSVQAKLGKWLTVPALIENALYWTDESSDLRCKCRPDFLVVHRNAAVVIDVKTTADVRPSEFQRRAESMGYWLQDAHYSAGVRAVFKQEPLFLFVAVETVWPFHCAVYEFSKFDRSEAYAAHQQLLLDVATCYETGNWEDDWQSQVTTLNLRKWAINGG